MIIDALGRELKVGQGVVFNTEALLKESSKVGMGVITKVVETVIDGPPNAPPLKRVEVTVTHAFHVPVQLPQVRNLWIVLEEEEVKVKI